MSKLSVKWVKQPWWKSENLLGTQPFSSRPVSLSALISQLQLLISCAPVEPGWRFSRTVRPVLSQLRLRFWAKVDWLWGITLALYFVLYLSLSYSLALSPCLAVLVSKPPPSFPSAFQWPCTPSAQSISPASWCVWCWRWLRWCACCRQWLSPVSLSTTWETTRRGRNLPLKTAATRMTRGIQGTYTTRSKQDSY